MDELSHILNAISINADVFFSGNLCGVQALGGTKTGHMHMLKSGVLTVLTNDGHKVVLNKPSVIYIPGPTLHRIISHESHNANLVCAAISLDSANQEQLVNALPQFMYFPIASSEAIGKSAQWLFKEAFEDQKGRQTMLDKLTDIFLLQVLRHVISEGTLSYGVMAGLSHPKLSRVIRAIHEHPQKQWSLEMLADLAAMSRSKFASFFKETVGQTPNDYIVDIRIAIAQDLLKLDKSVNLVANEVGYEHGSALARVFRKKLGLSPREWLQKLRNRGEGN